jgi:hypothetical protein
MSDSRLELLTQWQNPELCAELQEIKLCLFSLGSTMTRPQADEFEKFPVLFREAPSPTGSGRQRNHYTIKEVWKRVWKFIQLHPMFGAMSIDGILQNFHLVQIE